MYCILLAGIPASGKSTAAKKISEALSIPYFSKDTIKECLFDTIGFKNRTEKMKLNLGATKTMYYVAEQFMKCNMPFILENNFENATADEIKTLLNKYSYSPICIILTGDYRRIYERFCERQNAPDRHRGHVVSDFYPEDNPARKNPQMPYTNYENFVESITSRGMDKFRIDGENIVVDTTDIQNVKWDKLIENIKRLAKQSILC